MESNILKYTTTYNYIFICHSHTTYLAIRFYLVLGARPLCQPRALACWPQVLPQYGCSLPPSANTGFERQKGQTGACGAAKHPLLDRKAD